MSLKIQTEFEGLKKTLIALNKIDPELRKQFKQNAEQIAEPAVKAVKSAYRFVPLSGMSRKWDGGRDGRRVFPLDVNKARNGVKVKVSTSRKTTGVILIEQRNAGWAVFETAGRRTANQLGDQLGYVGPGRTRVIGPVVYSKINEIEGEMSRLVKDLIKDIERRM